MFGGLTNNVFESRVNELFLNLITDLKLSKKRIFSSEFDDLIYERLNNSLSDYPNKEEVRSYSIDPDLSLYTACKEHASLHNKPITSKNLLVGVHTSYTYLNHNDKLKSKQQIIDLENYTIKFQELIKLKDELDFQLVLVDPIYHYVAFSSKLLEKGLIDAVYFTTADSGQVISASENEILAKTDQVIFGGYIGGCLDSYDGKLRELNENLAFDGILGMILKSPLIYHDALISDVVTEVDDSYELADLKKIYII